MPWEMKKGTFCFSGKPECPLFPFSPRRGRAERCRCRGQRADHEEYQRRLAPVGLAPFIVGKRVLLVTSQTQEVHEEIEQTLEMLRKAGGLKSGARKLAEQEQAEDEADLPARPRVRPHRAVQPPMGQGFGGMGMGGMGGIGGGMPARGQTPFVLSVVPVIDGNSPGGDADLLGGLRNSNSANQQSKVQQLKKRQDAGQSGANGIGGGFF